MVPIYKWCRDVCFFFVLSVVTASLEEKIRSENDVQSSIIFANAHWFVFLLLYT